MKKKEFPKKKITVRIEDFLDKALYILSNETELTRTDLVELALLEFICNVEKTMIFKGVDLKKLGEVSKVRKLRNMTKVIRTEEKSRVLFMPRVERDILTYVANGKGIGDVIILLEIYKKEADIYENKTPLKEISILIDLLNKKKDENIDYLSILREALLNKHRIAMKIEHKINGKVNK